jgi:hypothetical protein
MMNYARDRRAVDFIHNQLAPIISKLTLRKTR